MGLNSSSNYPAQSVWIPGRLWKGLTSIKKHAKRAPELSVSYSSSLTSSHALGAESRMRV